MRWSRIVVVVVIGLFSISGGGVRAGGSALLWIDASGRPTADATDALLLLRGAAADGLDPADYESEPLDRLADRLRTGAVSANDAARFEDGLTAATLLYLRHLHMGRVDPRAAGFRMSAPADAHDFVTLMHSAVAAHRLRAAAAELAPQLRLYRMLRETLGRYRALAADPGLDRTPVFSAALRPGDPYADVGLLRRRLVALGDVTPDAPVGPAPTVYEGAIVEGVRRFQLRHGLAADGMIGDRTQAALRIPLGSRVRQIELALERLRWLPHAGEDRLLAVNIPMFHLWAWESMPPNGSPSIDMGVIVGRALNTETPVFVEEMRYVVFRPYWNIPSSILRNEILPAIAGNSDYLAQHDMEIVAGQSDDARPVALSADSLDGLRRGALRVRQRPGPRNALGLVKFVFPNDNNIYMHGTPAQELFSRPRRDFSHGCVRVEDPLALAEWALSDQAEWTRERIVAAMNGTRRSVRVDLRRPIQVALFYMTAVVMPQDGTVRFADDIYGHDAKLERALARARSQLRGSMP